MLTPLIPGSEVIRTMFVSKEVADAVMGPWGDINEEYRFGQLLQTVFKRRLCGVALAHARRTNDQRNYF